MKLGGFIHVLKTLSPRLDEVVLTGGWAWYLYRKYLTQKSEFPGTFTRDVDVAVPRRLPSSRSNLDALLAAASFEREMFGEKRPPVTRHSWPTAAHPEAIVEFLTPARGSGAEATLGVDGIVAQQLRFLDLLLEDPLRLDLDERAGKERFAGTVRVPQVGLFVLQKALTFQRRRERLKRYKDLAYLFDLTDESRGLQETIRHDIQRYSRKHGLPAATDKAMKGLLDECGSPDAGGVARVIEQTLASEVPTRTYVSETFIQLVEILGARAPAR